jgi:hypothetical protein
VNEVFGQLGKKYGLGDLYGLYLGTQFALVLNKAEDVHELLLVRGKKYSGRLYHTTDYLFTFGDRNFVQMNAGKLRVLMNDGGNRLQ